MPDDGRVTGERMAPHPSGASAAPPSAFGAGLTRGEDVVDLATWAGSVPAATGVAPRTRLGSKWFNLLWLLPIGFVVLLGAVTAAKGLRHTPSVQQFIAAYPGTDLRADRGDYLGLPAWARWQHFFNLFFMLFILRSGLQILSDHPRLYWTRHCTPGRDWFRIPKPVPADPLWTAKQDSISLPGQGRPARRPAFDRAGPLVAPRDEHAVAAQRADLLPAAVPHPAVETPGPDQLDGVPQRRLRGRAVAVAGLADRERLGSLQRAATAGLLVTVFVAAPLALITGLGMSPALSTRFKRISRVLSIQTARSLHFLIFAWFLLFILTHVSLVFTTGLLTNLNHINSGRNDNSWLGFWIFAGWMAVVVAAWVAATPVTLRHPRLVQRVGYALIGPVQHLFQHVDVTPGAYTEKDISPYFWDNGRYPDSPEYQALAAPDFADYRLRIGGLVTHPV